MRTYIFFGAAIIVLTALACAALAIPFLQISENSAPYTLAAGGETEKEFSALDIDVKQVALFISAAFTLWMIVKAVKSGHGIALFAIAVIAFLAYAFLFSDKNSDGIGDPQIIRVVQPVGDNPSIDTAYSKVNKTNSTANVIGAATFGIYVLVFLIGIIGVGFLFVMKKN